MSERSIGMYISRLDLNIFISKFHIIQAFSLRPDVTSTEVTEKLPVKFSGCCIRLQMNCHKIYQKNKLAKVLCPQNHSSLSF